jgi:hypothetical protein
MSQVPVLDYLKNPINIRPALGKALAVAEHWISEQNQPEQWKGRMHSLSNGLRDPIAPGRSASAWRICLGWTLHEPS